MRVAIVGGGGGVGASTAFNLLLARTGLDVALVDPRAGMVTSHAMDLEQVLELSPGSTVREGTPDDLASTDVVVVTAAAPLVVNTSRNVYLGDNARILDEVGERLDAGWCGVVVIVTNPVDPLVMRFRRRTGLDRRRVLGYTANDGLRLQTGLAHAFGVAAGSVSAPVIGEHGDSAVPLFDRVAVDGSPRAPTAAEAAAALEFLRTWYVRHVALDSGRSSTWTSGLGVARMVGAILSGGEAWPASVVLEGEYGIDGVAVSVPVDLGPRGAECIHEWELTPEQRAALERSASAVRELYESVETLLAGEAASL